MVVTAHGVVTLETIQEARLGLRQVAVNTPLDYSEPLTKRIGLPVYLKLENLQRTGSFKLRGAFNKIRLLSEAEKRKGVIAASAGNHAQGVALAATQSGIKSTIIMPQGAPLTKVVNSKNYGAEVILYGDSYDAAYYKALEIQAERGSSFVHAFDDPAVIAGQGTVGLEILEALPSPEIIVVPVGGGGLISGLAIAVKTINPRVKIVGVQAEGAPSMYLSRTSEKLRELSQVSTIADGIAVKRPGELTYPLVKNWVDDLVVVSDEELAAAMLMLLERAKIVAEGAGAVSLAAVLTGKVAVKSGPVVCVISGGNIDVHLVSHIIERGLVEQGRYIRLRTVLADRPGALQRLLGKVAGLRANVISIAHDRTKPTVSVTQAEVILTLETKDNDHIEEITRELAREGYPIQKISD